MGVTSHQGEQESCSQGEARQVEYGQQPRGRCDAKSQTGADHHAPSHTGGRVSTGELLDTETVTSSSEEGGWKRTCEGNALAAYPTARSVWSGGKAARPYLSLLCGCREKATTPGYQQVRREHRAIERKLAEVVRQHDGRRARYRGRARVSIQYLLTGLLINVKRMVRLLLEPAQPSEECAMV